MGTLNYTTQIAAGKTVGEMQSLLANHGASRISIDYDGNAPCAMSFMRGTPHGPRHFTLPVNVDAMHRLLVKQDREGKLRTGSRAARTSQRAGRARRLALHEGLAGRAASAPSRRRWRGWIR